MKNLDNEWYTATAADKQWAEMMEWFSGEQQPAASPEELDLLRDKIEMHLAYANLHRASWQRFEAMANQQAADDEVAGDTQG